jgi:Domain of unknown function (DUF4465)/PEP-CTERM motif
MNIWTYLNRLQRQLVTSLASNRSATCVLGFACCFGQPLSAAMVIDFNELNAYTTTGPTGSYFDGYGATASTGTWQSQGAVFNTGMFSPGWSYSNVDNKTTPGFTNQWAAYPGTGIGGSGNYAIGTTFTPNGAFINLPSGQTVNSISISNTTYAALSMLNGDGFAKKFGGMTGADPDFFRVTFTGFDGTNAMGAATGSVEFYLADYRFANNALDYLVDDWRLVDLTSLGAARSVGIGFDGSDNGTFGLNTPAYVAIDSLTFSSVPEPSSLFLLATGIGLSFARRRTIGRVSNEGLE